MINPDAPPVTPDRLDILNGELLTLTTDGRRIKLRTIHDGGYDELKKR